MLSLIFAGNETSFNIGRTHIHPLIAPLETKRLVLLSWLSKAHVSTTFCHILMFHRLYADIVNDSLTEYSYAADLAGLSYNLMSQTNGLYISINGYNDKLSVLVRKVLETVKGLSVDPHRLIVIKEQVLILVLAAFWRLLKNCQNQREWRNFFLGQSYTLSDYFCRYLLTADQWSVEEKLKELPCKHATARTGGNLLKTSLAISADEIQTHIKQLLSQVNLRMFVAGNIYKDVRSIDMEGSTFSVSSSGSFKDCRHCRGWVAYFLP